MSEYDHKKFIRENDIQKDELSVPLKRMVESFEEMEGLLPEIKGDKIFDFVEKMKELDVDILHELLCENGDCLTNNDLPSEEPSKGTTSNNFKILDKLWLDKNRFKLTKSYLEELGLDVNYNQSQISENGYVLKRTSLFSFEYTLSKQH